MPDVASEKALERLKLKNCVEEERCSIELKEVGQNKKTKDYSFSLNKSLYIIHLST